MEGHCYIIELSAKPFVSPYSEILHANKILPLLEIKNFAKTMNGSMLEIIATKKELDKKTLSELADAGYWIYGQIVTDELRKEAADSMTKFINRYIDKL